MAKNISISTPGSVTIASRDMEPTMSSREIAELTGKLHKNVLADIDKMLNALSLPEERYAELSANPQNGQNYRIYRLPKNLTYTLIAGYRADLRLKIVDRWIALEGGAKPAPKPKRVRKPAVDVAFRRCKNIADMLPNFDENQRLLMAARGTFNMTGTNPLELLGVPALEAPTNEHYFTPTELGGKRGVSGMKMNTLLAAAGLQRKEASGWVMTERGQNHGRIFDTTRKGGKGSQSQLKWKERVLDYVSL